MGIDAMGMDRQIEKKSRIRRNLRYVIPGTLIGVMLIYIIAFTDRSFRLNVDKEIITIDEVKEGLFKDYIAVIGTVEPIQTIYLDVTEGGCVEEIYAEEGTMLKEGDEIIRLSNDNLVLEISNNEAQVARAINDLKGMRVTLENQQINNKTQLVDLHYDLLKLERNYNNNKSFFEKDFISNEELAISNENYERKKKHYELLKQKSVRDSVFMMARINASEVSIQNMQENLDLIRKRLGKMVIKAPVNGELATLNPKIGQVIGYGTRIGTINILDSYKLRVEIDEHYISRVVRKLQGECDFSGKDYKATITKIYPEVLEGRFAVDMTFDNLIPDQIRIGQTSRIRLELGESQNAILIPRGGFYQSSGGQWIFVVDESEAFATKRNIKIGRQNPIHYEVLEGLIPGEQVIVSSYDNYGDVDKLILK